MNVKISWITAVILLSLSSTRIILGNDNQLARIFKVLWQDFGIRIDFEHCTGQTVCLCYPTAEKSTPLINKTVEIFNYCDAKEEAFICAKHQITKGIATRVIVLTSAMPSQFVQKHDDTHNSFAFNISNDNAITRIENVGSFPISKFKSMEIRGFKQSAIKLYTSSCEAEGTVMTRNLQEVYNDHSAENSSMWELITGYMHETEMKILDVFEVFLRVVAGVVGVPINPTDTTTVSPTTKPTVTTSGNSSPASPSPALPTPSTTPMYPIPPEDATETTSSPTPDSASESTTVIPRLPSPFPPTSELEPYILPNTTESAQTTSIQ